eukprot:Nk52_evm48s208 gene=Nk52_evmTU48s208
MGDNRELMEYIKRMPKVELHAHLNGSLSDEAVRLLAASKTKHGGWTKGGSLTFAEIEALYSAERGGASGVSQGGGGLSMERNLSECFKLFNIIHELCNDFKSVKFSTESVIADFEKDGVVYLELRSTPKRVQETGLSKQRYLEAILEAIHECNNDPRRGIVCKLIVSINRKLSIEEAMENVHLAVDLKNRWEASSRSKQRRAANAEEGIYEHIVGIDLSGDPNINYFTQYISALQYARDHGLKITIHTSEIPNPQETDAIAQFAPDRIGHGTFYFEDLEQMNQNRKGCGRECPVIPVELCPTSNVLSGTSPSYTDHHFRTYFGRGYPICICTDDKGIFGTTLSREYYHMATAFGLSKQTLWDLSYGAIDMIFETSLVKLKDSKEALTRVFEMKRQFM